MTTRSLRGRLRRGRAAVIAVPYLWLLVFFLVPFAIVFKISLSTTAIAMPPYTPVLDPSEAVVIWLPVGRAMCELHTVDTAAGWEMASVAYGVRQWRARKNLNRRITSPTEISDRLQRSLDQVELRRRVEAAATVDELTQLWAEADAAGTWTSTLTAAAAARKKALLEGASNPTHPTPP